MSETATLCDICGKTAQHKCSLCGKHVCDKHYDSKSGLCEICKQGRRMK